MSDSFIRVPPDAGGKYVETESFTVGGVLKQRQRTRVYDPEALNTYGENLTVAPGNTVTLVSFSAPDDWRFYGIMAGGEVDGKFTVSFDLTTKYVQRTNLARRAADFTLPLPDSDAGGTTVSIKVTNTGNDTGAFEATLLGSLDATQ